MNTFNFLPKVVETIIINYKEQLEMIERYNKCMYELKNCFDYKIYIYGEGYNKSNNSIRQSKKRFTSYREVNFYDRTKNIFIATGVNKNNNTHNQYRKIVYSYDKIILIA